jgi:murein L,D-transpeptidase YcbB/YkuD
MRIDLLVLAAAATLVAAPASAYVPVTVGQVPPGAPVTKPAPDVALLSRDPQPAFTEETAALTETAAHRYLDIVQAGGWPTIHPVGTLAPGATGPAVVALKARLRLSEDLGADAAGGEAYDAALEAAVKHFQDRMGLEQTGTVGAQTLKALNVPAVIRYNQLVASAGRLRAEKFGFGPRYVVVNIPAATVEAVENGAVVRRYIAIVGKPDKASPQVATRIVSVNLNPTWTVPASIVKNEIIPHMQADPAYLAREKIRIFDTAGTEIDPASIDWATHEASAFTLRQDSGAGNSLGTLRIDMPNKYAVYMHDTPSKGAFGASFRFLSHGCVRVSGVRDLAAWLLADEKGVDGASWSRQAIDAAIAIGTRQDVKLTTPVPVAWVYLTGYATADGLVHFRNDVYDLDGEDPTGSIPGKAPPKSEALSREAASKPAAH